MFFTTPSGKIVEIVKSLGNNWVLVRFIQGGRYDRYEWSELSQ